MSKNRGNIHFIAEKTASEAFRIEKTEVEKIFPLNESTQIGWFHLIQMLYFEDVSTSRIKCAGKKPRKRIRAREKVVDERVIVYIMLKA